MKPSILIAALFSLSPALHAEDASLEWAHSVDRQVLQEMDASEGRFTSLQHLLQYTRKIKLYYPLKAFLIHGENDGYAVYELTTSRCVIICRYGKTARLGYHHEGLKHIGYQYLRNQEKGKTDINVAFGNIYEVTGDQYTIFIKTGDNTQTVQGTIPAIQTFRKTRPTTEEALRRPKANAFTEFQKEGK